MKGSRGVRERHVKAVDLHEAVLGHSHPLVAPVDLGLGSRQHFEAPVQLWCHRTDPWTGLGQVHLHALVAVGKAVVRDQALVDHRAQQARLLS